MYLISYDLSTDKLRQKVAKELENYGKRVQYSVFECCITEKQMESLYEKLSGILAKEENGNVRIYNICANCVKKICVIGLPDNDETLEYESDEILII